MRSEGENVNKKLQELYGEISANIKLAITPGIFGNKKTFDTAHSLREYLTSQQKIQETIETKDTTDYFKWSKNIEQAISFLDNLVEEGSKNSFQNYSATFMQLASSYHMQNVQTPSYSNNNVGSFQINFLENDNKDYDLILQAYKYYQETEKKESFLQFCDLVKSPQNIFSKTLPNNEGRLEAILLYQSFFLKDRKLLSQSALTKIKEQAYQEEVKTLQDEIANQNKNLVEFTNDQKQDTSKKFEDQVTNFEERYEAIETSTTDQLDEAQKKFDDIQQAYEQKLAFEEPIKYWKKQSRNRAIYAGIWAMLALVELVVTIFLSKWFLEQLYSAKTLTNTSIPQYFVPIAFISVLIYLLRVFINIAISSWHMSSEYSQKAALTFYYISMMKEGHISQEEKNLVLPALFSKIDTGLNKYQDNGDANVIQNLISSLPHK